MFFRNNNYIILVSKEVDLEHKSFGVLDFSWYKSTMDFYNKYKFNFPLVPSTMVLNKLELSKLEFSNGLNFVFHSLSYSVYKPILIHWMQLLLRNPLNKLHLKIVKKLVIKLNSKLNTSFANGKN
jgi:hypothetical protein